MRISDWSSDVCSSDLLGEDQVKRGRVALAVGDEDLDGNPRRAGADGSDHRSELPGAAVGEVVTGDGGDHREAQSHALDGLGDALGLVGIGGHRVAGVDEAEPAGPGAALAVDRSEEHTSELQSLMRISYAVFCFK